MNNIYTVRFYTRDIVNGEWDNEHLLAEYSSNKFIPIPQVNSLITLENNNPGLYKVTNVDYCYPLSESEIYTYEVDVIVEVYR